MTKEKTIKINGKLYSATTGLPIEQEASTTAKNNKSNTESPKKIMDISSDKPKKLNTNKSAAQKATRHTATKSKTLNRKTVKRPTESRKSTKVVATAPAPQKRRQMDIIAPKNAIKPSPILPKSQPPIEARSQEIKQSKVKETPQKRERKSGKIAAIISAVVILLAGLAVAAYFLLPVASFELATMRANIRGKLPTYTAENYSINGPVQSSPGQIIINYKSDNGEYSLIEQSSTWDSNGVLENKVKPNSKNHQTLSQKGLTIFRFDNKAIWVNGGILYTISSSNNNLSNDEILKIVDSI